MNWGRVTGILILKQKYLIEPPNGCEVFGVIPEIVRLGAAEALYLK